MRRQIDGTSIYSLMPTMELLEAAIVWEAGPMQSAISSSRIVKALADRLQGREPESYWAENGA